MLASVAIPAVAPVSPFVPAGGALLLLLAIGLLIWALGGRLLRPGLATIGLLAGLPLGIWVGGVVAPEAPPVLFAAGGALAGLVIACISYRLALAAVAAVLAAVIAVLGAWSAADLGFVDAGVAAHHIDSATGLVAAETPTPLMREALTQLWLARRATAPAESANASDPDGGIDGGGELNDAPPAEQGAIERTRAAVELLWSEMPQPRRTLLVASLAAGAVVGLLFGLLFADAAAKLVTSLAGSVILIVAGMPLLTACLGRSEDLLPPRPGAWFVAIAMLTIIGFGVQQALGAPPPRHARDEA